MGCGGSRRGRETANAGGGACLPPLPPLKRPASRRAEGCGQFCFVQKRLSVSRPQLSPGTSAPGPTEWLGTHNRPSTFPLGDTV